MELELVYEWDTDEANHKIFDGPDGLVCVVDEQSDPPEVEELLKEIVKLAGG